MESSASAPALSAATGDMKKSARRGSSNRSGSRHKVELYSAEYWKVWKSKINIGPQVDPVAEAKKEAAIEAQRAARRADGGAAR